MTSVSVITLLAGCMTCVVHPAYGSAIANSVTIHLAQQSSPWVPVKMVVGGGVTPEYRPNEAEVAQLSLLGNRRLRLINIDSRRVVRDSGGALHVEWSPHLLEGLRYCRDHGWVPRIIIGQTLLDSPGIGRPGADSSDSVFWAVYRRYIDATVRYVVEEWGFRESEWEVGNEMDIPGENWVAGGTAGVGSDSLRFLSYMRMYREISSVIGEYKRGHPTIILRIGGPAVSPGAFLNPQPSANWTMRFVDEISRDRSTLACDFVSFHLYGNSASGREAVAGLERLRARMAIDGISLPISVSEWGASWLADASLNFTPLAGAFALEFVRTVAAAGIDDAFFLALREFPNKKWPVLFTATGSPTHTMLALRLLAELQGSRAECSLDRPGGRCVAAVTGDSMRIVFWSLDWEAKRLPDRQFAPAGGTNQGLVIRVASKLSSLRTAKPTELLLDGASVGDSLVAIIMNEDSTLTARIGGIRTGPGSYGRLRMALSTATLVK